MSLLSKVMQASVAARALRPWLAEMALADSVERIEKVTPGVRTPWFQRAEPQYPGHVPLMAVERLAMFAVAGAGSFFTPSNNNYIVALGETSAIEPVLRALQEKMLQSRSGRRILREKPRITSSSLDLEYLRSLPKNSVGGQYVMWLDREGVSPDTREHVHFIDNPELAYVFQRYRECHDFYHAVTGLPVWLEGEIAVKCFEFCNLGLPFAGLGAVLAPWRLKPGQRKRLLDVYYPWAIENGLRGRCLLEVYWEEELETDVSELRQRLGISAPPDLRDLRSRAKAVHHA